MHLGLAGRNLSDLPRDAQGVNFLRFTQPLEQRVMMLGQAATHDCDRRCPVSCTGHMLENNTQVCGFYIVFSTMTFCLEEDVGIREHRICTPCVLFLGIGLHKFRMGSTEFC